MGLRQPLMRTLALALAGLCLMGTMAGCVTGIDGRIAQRQEIFDTYAPEVQERVRRGQIRLGDDTDTVWMVYGTPSEKVRRTTEQGVSEVWIYKVLGYHESLYPTVRPVYYHNNGRLRTTYMINDTPEYEWQEALRVEFVGGRVSAVQMRE